MIDHLSIGTHQIDKSVEFYTNCLATLGYGLQHRDHTQAIFGIDGKWIFCLYPAEPGTSLLGHRSHVAFSAPSKTATAAFHQAALALGASTLREPGPRADINPEYYGTIVKDLDGHTIEVVHWDSAAGGNASDQ
ncbi:VOC family protein [Paraherbaspirillum soli]|uniref:VOC family protein n=1 Tax=Paraherbaspirillum soli TaxID=631222 RepID=A0ABW0MEM2_9BURK